MRQDVGVVKDTQAQEYTNLTSNNSWKEAVILWIVAKIEIRISLLRIVYVWVVFMINEDIIRCLLSCACSAMDVRAQTGCFDLIRWQMIQFSDHSKGLFHFRALFSEIERFSSCTRTRMIQWTIGGAVLEVNPQHTVHHDLLLIKHVTSIILFERSHLRCLFLLPLQHRDL